MGAPHVRILTIDDSADVREFFELALESAGYEVRVAADGAEGLEVLKTFQPDLIITDISMPGMNGFEFLIRLRSDVAPPLPPVIVCSGFDVTAEEAMRLGAVCFLAKPIEPPTLLHIVAQILGGEMPNESLLAREREFAQAARARAAAAAARLLTNLDLQHPAVLSALTRFTQWVQDYFGGAPAYLVLVERGDLKFVSVGRGSIVPAGMVASGKGLYATGVLASGSSLVMSDARPFYPMMDPKAAQLGLRFAVAVPLSFNDSPVGALCLFDRTPRVFAAEDLLTLEQIGREATIALRAVVPVEQFGENIGFVPPTLFDGMLGAELAISHRQGGGVEFILAEVDPEVLCSDLALELQARGGARLAVCRQSPGMVAIFKRDSKPEAATNGASQALAVLEGVTSVHAASWISVFGAQLPQLSQSLVQQLAKLALDDARSASPARTERIVIRRDEWPSLAGHPAAPAGG